MRPKKTGLDFIPMNFLERTEQMTTLRQEFGNDALAVVVAVYGELYRNISPLLLSQVDRVSVTAMVEAEKAREIINRAASIGLFNSRKLLTGEIQSDAVLKLIEKFSKERNRKRNSRMRTKPKLEMIANYTLSQALAFWALYKKERKEKWLKSSEKALLKRFEGRTQELIEAIHYSHSQGFAGVFSEKRTQKKTRSAKLELLKEKLKGEADGRV